MTELSVSNRYIASDMSDDRFLLKFQAYSYYQGIMFWILEFFQPYRGKWYTPHWYPDFNAPDTNATNALLILKDKVMKSKAKVSDLGSRSMVQQL
jgi:hypothetical protein